MTIRSATLNDVDRIAVLCGQLGYQASSEQVLARLRRMQDDEDNAVFVVGESGDVAGWIHVCVRRTLESGECAEITGLVVDEKLRGAGLGRRLVEQAGVWAKERGQQLIRVRTNVVREETHRFYRALGFEEMKKQVVFRKGI